MRCELTYVGVKDVSVHTVMEIEVERGKETTNCLPTGLSNVASEPPDGRLVTETISEIVRHVGDTGGLYYTLRRCPCSCRSGVAQDIQKSEEWGDKRAFPTPHRDRTATGACSQAR